MMVLGFVYICIYKFCVGGWRAVHWQVYCCFVLAGVQLHWQVTVVCVDRYIAVLKAVTLSCI